MPDVTPTVRVRFEVVLHIREGEPVPTERDLSMALAHVFAGYHGPEFLLPQHVGTEVTAL